MARGVGRWSVTLLQIARPEANLHVARVDRIASGLPRSKSSRVGSSIRRGVKRMLYGGVAATSAELHPRRHVELPCLHGGSAACRSCGDGVAGRSREFDLAWALRIDVDLREVALGADPTPDDQQMQSVTIRGLEARAPGGRRRTVFPRTSLARAVSLARAAGRSMDQCRRTRSAESSLECRRAARVSTSTSPGGRCACASARRAIPDRRFASRPCDG